MAQQRYPSRQPSFELCLPRPAKVVPRARIAPPFALAVGWLVGCANLLGIEEATCDPSYDLGCVDRSVGPLFPNAGAGGTPAGAGGAPAGAGGSAGDGGNAMAGGNAGAGGSAGAQGNGGAAAGAAGEVEVVPMLEPPLCDRYCDTIAAACSGENEQFVSLMACRAVCALLEPGERGSMTGNTVECRLSLARLARDTGEPVSYCHSAGPGGGGLCGTGCEGFCTIMAEKCTLMGTFNECLPLCDAVPNLTDEDESATYSTSIQGGDSLQCRLYHVTAAALDPPMHCAHAAGVALCAND